ncbi:amidophosphoribosyltransferase [Anaerosphaera aminiphila DSM 21120]|uniref:Amidophosphoribosyltransferase n=1 Tax=Anaerosphaera aminiphila DSM 21120 TaxID=1120995 RepID=A0A1M5RW07_9FIRM|nr:amidophosphoribosyltransferase [Anaerosphaera aminiphila]SHH30507.1 amidophosphoribosyltransferase [Anaerosphaera aminiphila DSM 21120]
MCGIIGIYSDSPVNKKLFYGLNSLQHRGQESCGITVSNSETLLRERGMGLVIDVFDENKLNRLEGNLGIGHTRYSTEGGNYEYNTQPLLSFTKGTEISISHNGNLINYQILKTRLEEDGMMFQTTSDTEVILFLIARYYKDDIVDAIKKTMDVIEGAYSVVLLLKDKLVAFRDNRGIRPLVIGETESGDTVIASENAPIEIMGGRAGRNILPGEIVVVDENGINSYFHGGAKKPKHCIFEYVYFARDDATLDKVNSYNFRRRCGEIISREAPCDVDLVVPVPDSGIPSAIGYSQETKIPFAEGLVKNRYMGRTFIKPTQEEREMAVKLKLNPLRHVIEGKKIVLIDDSIVRGTTSANLIRRMRDAGAKEVHLRITSPPVEYPCYYGINTPSRMNLIAANNTVEEIRERIDADSLAFISMEGLQSATLIRDDRFCKACFNGEYPVDPVVI